MTQLPKSLIAIRTQQVITARLGFFPFGCVIPAIPGVGKPVRYCPLYAICARIPPEDTVLCEVTETEAQIDITKPVPDGWLHEVAEPLRRAYDLDWLLSLDSSEFE